LEKIIPSAEYLPLFLPLLATSGTGQQITGYNSIIRGPRSDGENDGPKHMYVILLDNGRSSVYSNPTSRDILRCIRCGACLNECPVYRTVGGHSYGTTYQGPVGSVLTPHLRGLEQWQHLSSASSLCGACTTACPVEIPIHELLLDNRWQAHRSGQTSTVWSAALKIWAQLFSNRKLLNAAMSVHRKLGNGLPALLPHGKQKRVPVLPGKTFAQWWEENEQSG
jgi:L-lactate dehydrogenase complex protein LldF